MRRRWVTFQGAVGSPRLLFLTVSGYNQMEMTWIQERSTKISQIQITALFCSGSALNVCGKPMNFPDERPHSKASPKSCKNVKQRSFRLDWKGCAQAFVVGRHHCGAVVHQSSSTLAVIHPNIPHLHLFVSSLPFPDLWGHFRFSIFVNVCAQGELKVEPYLVIHSFHRLAEPESHNSGFPIYSTPELGLFCP